MNDEVIKKIVSLSPSEFYRKLWKAYFSGKLSKEKKDKLAALYEANKVSIEDEIDEVFTEPDFIIKVPIWESKSVGLNEAKLKDKNTVKIAYRDKDGHELYPNTYVISKEKALKYPTKNIKGNRIRIIPIADMEVL